MSEKKSSTYVPTPKVDEKLQPRYEAVLRALGGQLTVSGAAESLQMSRNHFQTLMHRAMASVIDALEPKSGGRPRKSEREKELEAELDRLQRENRKLADRVAMIERLLGVAGDLVSGKVAMRRPRASPTPSAVRNETSNEGEDPDPKRATLRRETEMNELGVPAKLRAAVLGCGASTLRRWRRKFPGSVGRPRKSSPEAVASAKEVVRKLHGQIGAAALSKKVTGISRRVASEVTASVRILLERERKERTQSVVVKHAGAIRGFDAMDLGRGAGYVLVTTDASVPYRTSMCFTKSYDSEAVVEALRRDFAENGAPLVVRMDRATQHRTGDVLRLLAEHGVAVLHGPPRHPRFYGQLERQNREHRPWLEDVGSEAGEIDQRLAEMMHALNHELPRRRTGWCTAGDAWRRRGPLPISRELFLQVLDEERKRLEREQPALEHLRLQRLAIEAALIKHGLLEVRPAKSARSF